MKVLSLFDGISCGMVALERAGIKVDHYVAYEIDKYAVQVSEKNYPRIKHRGDVFEGNFKRYKGCDLLIGGSPCVPKGTKVKVYNGYKDIADIAIGDLVLTHKNRYMPVTRLYQRESDHIYHIKFNGNQELKITGNHPVYTYRDNGFKFVRVDELTTEDTVCINIPTEEAVLPFSDDILWLVGRALADGYYSKEKKRVIISVGKNKISEFESHLKGINYYICHKNRPAPEYCIKSSELTEAYSILGNNKAIHKVVTEPYLNANKRQLKLVWDGYISGDGCTRKDKPQIAMWNSSSEDLILSLGLVTAKLFQKYPTTSVRKPEYKLLPSGMHNTRTNYNSQVSTLRKANTVVDDKLLVRIKSITREDILIPVYNIEVAEDHSYTVNNCIVHNCTYWSIAKAGREVTPDGIGGQLFMQYVRALKESGAKYFLYENNYSIHKDIKEFISEQLGVQPIMINSALVSAQQRKRCYWTNIPNVTQPEDKGILLQDILEDGMSWQDKSYCMTSYNGAVAWNTLKRGQRSMVAVPVNPMPDGKARTIKAQYSHTSMANFIREDNLAATGVASPIRLGHIGNTDGQANRVYSVRGKSVCIQSQAGGGGAKTGLYKIDLPDGDYIIRKLTPIEAERLQTLPDNYTEGISNSQRYKCIGNGWTVDVIAHILSFLPEEEKQ